MRISSQIQRLRLQNQFSIREIAARTGLRPGFVSLLEEGEEIPTLEVLQQLATALGVPLYEFFNDGRPPYTPWLTARPTLREFLAERLGCVPSWRMLLTDPATLLDRIKATLLGA